MIRYQSAAQIAGPVVWSWQFDSLGQMLQLTEPSTALQQRSYSDWGDLKEVTWTPPSPEPKHSIVKTYDALGRITRSEEQNDGVTNAETVKKYHYDVPGQSPLISPTYVLGKLATAKSPTSEVVLSYDAFGRVNARSFTDGTQNVYIEQHGFHADGSQAWIELNLPDNSYKPERVGYTYDTAGMLRKMWFSDGQNTEDIYRATDLDAWGRVRLAKFGKKAGYRANYAERGRRLIQDTKIETDVASRSIRTTGFDAVGRELSRSEETPSFGDRTHSYDALGRLKTSSWVQNGTPVGQWTFDYDSLGNILSLNESIGSSIVQMSYQTTDRDRICRIEYSGIFGIGCNVEYDSLGNTIYEPSRTGYNKLTYFNSGDVRTLENELGIRATFLYDAFGAVEALDIVSDAGLLRSDRNYGAYITQRSQKRNQFSVNYLSRQFPGPGLVVSRRGRTGPWIYQFNEPRGTRITADQEGNFVQDFSYAPYGETSFTGAAPASATFTTEQWNDGQFLDGFGGLVQVGARIYDPVIGRFLSRDPLLISAHLHDEQPVRVCI